MLRQAADRSSKRNARTIVAALMKASSAQKRLTGKTVPRTLKPIIRIGLSAGVRYAHCVQGKYLYVRAPQVELYNQA
jgi:hypothetical protein